MINNKDEKQIREERKHIFFKKYRQLEKKLKSLGVKKKSILTAASDLSDIYLYASDIRKNIGLLIKTSSSDLGKIVDVLTDLRIILDQMKDHIEDTKKPLTYLSEMCDKEEQRKQP